MFTLDESSTYWYPVSVEMIDAGGRTKKFSFDAEFERLPQDEINELFRKREEGEEPLRDADLVTRVFKGWKPEHIKDAQGNPLEVNDTNREKLLNIFPVPRSIVRAYLKSIGVEGKVKN